MWRLGGDATSKPSRPRNIPIFRHFDEKKIMGGAKSFRFLH